MPQCFCSPEVEPMVPNGMVQPSAPMYELELEVLKKGSTTQRFAGSEQSKPPAAALPALQEEPFQCLSVFPSAESQAMSPMAGLEGSAAQATFCPAVAAEDRKVCLTPWV